MTDEAIPQSSASPTARDEPSSFIDRVRRAIQGFDVTTEEFNEVAVFDSLREAATDSLKSDDGARVELASEFLAFSIMPARASSPWGTYFAPLFEIDAVSTAASRDSIGIHTIAHWKKRANEVRNAILKARYADAAWDFAKIVKGERRDINMARSAIDAYIESSKLAGVGINAITRLKRALSISLSIGDVERSNSVQDALVDLYQRIADPLKPGIFTFLFDSLIDVPNVTLSQGRESDIIKDLESALETVSSADSKPFADPFRIENYTIRLMKYYRARNDGERVKQLAAIAARAFEQRSPHQPGPVALHDLEKAEQIYRKNGLVHDADRVLLLIKPAGRRARSEATRVEEEVEVDMSKINDAAERIVGEGGSESAFRIAAEFLLHREKIKRDLLEEAAVTPLISLIPIRVLSEDQPVETIGSVQDDEETRLIHRAAQQLVFDDILLRPTIHKFFKINSLNGDWVADCFGLNMATCAFRGPILRKGLERYTAADYVSCVHVLVPEIERGVRTIAENVGIPANRAIPGRGFEDRTFGAVLADPEFRKKVDEDVAWYLRVLLTEKAGWNLRNRVAHGLIGHEEMGVKIADRLLHALFLVAFVSKILPETPAPSGLA